MEIEVLFSDPFEGLEEHSRGGYEEDEDDAEYVPDVFSEEVEASLASSVEPDGVNWIGGEGGDETDSILFVFSGHKFAFFFEEGNRS